MRVCTARTPGHGARDQLRASLWRAPPPHMALASAHAGHAGLPLLQPSRASRCRQLILHLPALPSLTTYLQARTRDPPAPNRGLPSLLVAMYLYSLHALSLSRSSAGRCAPISLPATICLPPRRLPRLRPNGRGRSYCSLPWLPGPSAATEPPTTGLAEACCMPAVACPAPAAPRSPDTIRGSGPKIPCICDCIPPRAARLARCVYKRFILIPYGLVPRTHL